MVHTEEELRKYLSNFGQEHLVKFLNEISVEEKQHLLEDINQTDFNELNLYYQKIKLEQNDTIKEIDSSMQPVPAELKGSYVNSNKEKLDKYEEEGLKAISDGEVAVLLLAGGQGTRLGVNYPKGMYSVDLLSQKTLYQLQAERLIRLKQIALNKFPNEALHGSIPWYIMTSEHTQESTNEFFRKNEYFGLDKDNIILFEQFMLPCLTNDGKVILDEKYKISKAPDGNGGLYKALLKKNILEDMNKRGIKYLHIYGVDNILVRMADPVFIGFCIEKQANCAAKVVKKVDPDEKVGIICKVNDKFQVVEYSEISNVTRNLRDKSGELIYNAGNICNHFLAYDFLEKLCREHEKDLKNHVAEKKIPYIDDSGNRILPQSNNGIKLEKFVFDVFPFSNNFAIWEVPRDEEFSPLKNSDDAKKETPTTCRLDLSAKHTRWLVNAGAILKPSIEPVGEGATIRNEIEVSPLVSYNGENLEQYVKGKVLGTPLYLELKDKKVLFNGLTAEEYEKKYSN